MRAYVIGDPVQHSLSPAIHNAAYRHCGIAAHFATQQVGSDQLSDFMAQLPADLLGLAVTMPHKQAIFSHVDAVEPLAQAVGAINTVIPSANVRTGFNTDVYGIAQALVETAGGDPDFAVGAPAVILGARATASSALAALGQLHVGPISVVARSFGGPGSISLAQTRLGVQTTPIPWRDQTSARAALAQARIVVSTVPAQVADVWAEQLRLEPEAVILDAAYHPWPSRLAQAGTALGARICSGHAMLVHQACQQFTLMTGQPAPVEVMRQALPAAVEN